MSGKRRTEKFQTTISGFNAWAFAELIRAKGQKPGDVARYIVERWFDDNAGYLSQFGITRQAFQREEHGAPVVPLNEKRDHGHAK